jgi:hypothetical protein
MSREHLRLLLNWLSRDHGHRRSWVVVPVLGTPWQDNLTDRGLRWRERAAYLHGQRVFGVDYLI